MNLTLKRLTPLLGLLVLLAGCGKGTNPFAPVVTTPLRSLTLSVHVDTLNAGGTLQFTAMAVDTFGLPYTKALNWASSNQGVFVVNSTGLVTGVGEGTALLVVSSGGKADTASVLVYPTVTGWLVQTSNATEDLYDVFVDAAGRLGWAVGADGVVLSTTNAGATWTRQLPTTFTLRGVWFTSAQEGWAAGYSGTLLHTLNGGSTWTRITSTATGENLMDVYFASRDTGWVVGTNGLIMATNDRGLTWHKSNPTGQPLNAVMFAGTRDGWAAGDGGVVLGTHDRGVTWFTVPFATAQPLRGLWRHDTARAVAVGAGGVALRTSATPDSVAWTLGNAGSAYQLEGACLPDTSIGWAVGWNGTAGVVLHSADGAETWSSQAVSSSYRLRGVFFLDVRRGWVVGDNGTIRHTTSGGE